MNIEQEKMIVESLPSLYPLQEFEEKAIQKVIDALPLAQPKIIRCKDCRYYNAEEKECLDLLGHGRRWEEDDFCSYGAKMEVTT